MAKLNRGRFTISANIILTALVITRGFSFGFIMMSIYIKYGDAILDEDVIKIADMEYAAGMPLGTAVKSVVFSFIGVFMLELITGVCGILGVLRHSKTLLSITVVMNSLMIVIYGIYIVILSIIYNKKYHLNLLETYTDTVTRSYITDTYLDDMFSNFKRKLGCKGLVDFIYDCRDAYAERIGTYIEAYLGLTVTCIVCQVASIIAVEYTYRKFEFKENKSTIAKTKYYLLLSLQFGIFRNFVIFVKNSWKRSKVSYVSSLLKITAIIVAAGFLGLGLTLIGDVMIHDFYIRYIFYRIEFYNYYFYDILVGVAASSVVIGILTMINTIIGLFGSWRKCPTLIMTSTVTSLILTIPRIVAFLVWVVFMAKINTDMQFKLKLLQDGYYLNDESNELTTNWNHMLITLQCCGVDSQNDTINSKFGERFCCSNAHESRMDITGSYTSSSSVLDNFGYCGGHRTSTCSESILFKTRMYIGWFLAMLLQQICLEAVTVILANKEYSAIMSIEKSQKTNLFRNILQGLQSILITYWKRSKIGFTSVGCILVLSVGLLGLGINIRYDVVFGNRDIQEMFSQIYTENISLKSIVEYSSIVIVTFSSIHILVSIYSAVIVMVRAKWRYTVMIITLCLWCVLVMASIIQLGLMAKVIAHINPSLEEILLNGIDRYEYSQASGNYSSAYSANLNTLFIKAQCCGAGTSNVHSFTGSGWYLKNNHITSQQIPVQCCKSQTILYPYGSRSDYDCTISLSPGSYHTQGCDVAIKNHLQKYSITFIVFISVIILAEISLIITNTHSLITYRQDSTAEQELVVNIDTAVASSSTSSKSDKVPTDIKKNDTGQPSKTETENSIKKVASLNMTNINTEDNISHSMALQPTVLLADEINGNQEQEYVREQNQKINDGNMETEDVRSDYEKKDEDGSKLTSLEENTAGFSEEQI